ncbi:MAG TPA: POTRA domain-containing protein [Pyrinomonadaceae bacterium]|nr:POTRA domain-containing protein [Pyrinomonadaceae bacterium]
MRHSYRLLILAASLTLAGLATSGTVLSQTTQSAGASERQPCDYPALPGRPTLTRRAEPARDTSAVVEKKQIPVNCKNLERKVTLRFVGLRAFHELDAIKLLREAGANLTPDRLPNAETTEKAAAILKQLLGTKGYFYAIVNVVRDEDLNSLTFHVTEGERLPLAEIRFEGTRVFSADELKAITKQCFSDARKPEDGYDQESIEYCLRRAADFMRNKAYLHAMLSEPKLDITAKGIVATVKVEEGSLYRLGQITIEGADHYSAEDIRKMLPLSPGDIVAADRIGKWLFEDLKKIYGDLGYIEYTAEPVPEFRNTSGVEGVVDFKVIIEEGDRFILSKLVLEGEQLPTSQFISESPLKLGDIYSASAFDAFVSKLNQSGMYESIDKDKDSDFRVDNEERLVSITLKLRRRGQP